MNLLCLVAGDGAAQRLFVTPRQHSSMGSDPGRDGDGTGEDDRTDPNETRTASEASGATAADDDRVVLGLALLERLEHESLSLADVVDRIETVTSDPTVTRTILDQPNCAGLSNATMVLSVRKAASTSVSNRTSSRKRETSRVSAVARDSRQATSLTSRRVNWGRLARRVFGRSPAENSGSRGFSVLSAVSEFFDQLLDCLLLLLE